MTNEKEASGDRSGRPCPPNGQPGPAAGCLCEAWKRSPWTFVEWIHTTDCGVRVNGTGDATRRRSLPAESYMKPSRNLQELFKSASTSIRLLSNFNNRETRHTTKTMVSQQSIRRPNPTLPDSVFEMFRMRGKVVIITGGTGGIGYQVARGLAEAGADIALWYQNSPQAEQLAISLAKEFGVKSKAYKCSVQNFDEV
ncbi:uncharacterized protein N7459_000048 [Penicillium hispanicum]|uniref:uncharacterized protein n=1 Tax=Penicillium hispanicum TaxID=1080232 RepID=UPI002541044B|nr:uncharacterized protein N7459_000048 [Penicillium hispanicum]KAJ5593840.1 hypothetical protein N7459_000048 [Penicillium hispanicum]